MPSIQSSCFNVDIPFKKIVNIPLFEKTCLNRSSYQGASFHVAIICPWIGWGVIFLDTSSQTKDIEEIPPIMFI